MYMVELGVLEMVISPKVRVRNVDTRAPHYEILESQ
jgi:hypothetical protein